MTGYGWGVERFKNLVLLYEIGLESNRTVSAKLTSKGGSGRSIPKMALFGGSVFFD